MSAPALVLLHFLKLVAVCALAAGTIGAFLPRAWEDRRRAARWLAAPAFFATWILGVLLVLGTARSLLEHFVLGAAAASFVSINAVMWASAKEGRRGPGAATIAIAGLVAAIALMVWR